MSKNVHTDINIDIEERHYKIVVDILSHHLEPTDKVFVFGSRAKFTAKKYSDLDLAIISNANLYALAEVFEDSDLPFTVDVLDYNKIPQHFRDEIDNFYILLNFRFY